ncbi:MAG: hypothetical protein FWD53_07120 [Phycisphaerales bacterium]|nr:hypothetical protein [Phycisphaerales bacterium]
MSHDFPTSFPPASRTAEQLLKLVAREESVTFDEQEFDRLAMLLSQATCRDFASARKLLAARLLSPGQWRRVLNSAAARESMRVHIEEQLDRLAEIPDDDSAAGALIAEGDVADPDAWTVIARFLYYLRHDYCDACRRDSTGLSCIYLSFDSFLQVRLISADRAKNWQKIIRHHLGLS